MQAAGGLMFASGTGGIFGTYFYMLSLTYPAPPVPMGHIVGLLAIIIGGGSAVGSSCIAFKDSKRAPWITSAIISLLVIAYGITEVLKHPYELPYCPCAVNTYGPSCEYLCPSNSLGICSGRGTCDEGKTGSGSCFCDEGWTNDCSVCDRGFEGDNCDQCKRGWKSSNEGKCDMCYPGYSGTDCNVCDIDWIAETDVFGTLCRNCKPGRWGGLCKPCQNCTLYDPLATCRDNVWHETNAYTASCTPEGKTCNDKYDCSSNNCKGTCVIGDETTGQTCESDGQCFPGKCEFKECCLEDRHGNGHCQCGSMGHFGEDCAPCPGYDGVYSATICTGHGTCASQYAGTKYVGLSCECAQDGTEPYPAWSGGTCSCLKDTAADTACTKCATGSFGSHCTSCPGGSGIGQCNMHGKCDDGVNGTGTCTCDVDVKYGGLGAFKGASCSSCLSNDFYGANCRTCPNIQVVQCDSQGFLATLPNSGNCLMSCGALTCSDDGICT